MAPTVYIADLSSAAETPPQFPRDLELELERSHVQERTSKLILGVGVNNARARRRNMRAARARMQQNRRVRGSIWLRTPIEDTRQSMVRDDETRISPGSAGSDSNSSYSSDSKCASPLDSSPRYKSPLLATERLLLLRRRRDGLLDITLRTMKLMRRNQQLQHRLAALQAETRAFVRSVLSNPENQGLTMLLDKHEHAPDSECDEDTHDSADGSASK